MSDRRRDAGSDLAEATAARLVELYGDEAPLRAALAARKAIETEDVESCRLWREIIDLLVDRQGSACIAQ